MSQDFFLLKEEFNKKTFRLCTIGNKKFACVYDVVKNITGNQNIRDSFRRLKSENPKLVANCDTFKFPGRGQGTTPVANGQIMLEIVFALQSSRVYWARLIS